MNKQLLGQQTAGVIRFDRPASVWEEAYPIGNGKLAPWCSETRAGNGSP